MADLDLLAPNYRRAQERWRSAPTLLKGHEALCVCFEGNAHGMIEHIKAFIESVCRTILKEFNVEIPASPSTTDLLVAALRPLGLQNSRGASKLDRVLSGFNKLSDALSAMRDENGPIAHGKDGFLDAITADHARAFLHTGDAILGVLLHALEGKEPALETTREPYERFEHHHDRIDAAVGLSARIDLDGDVPYLVVGITTSTKDDPVEFRILPSQFLYGVDRLAYIDVLKSVAEQPTVPYEVDEQPAIAENAAEPAALSTAPETPPEPAIVATYTGDLASLRDGMAQVLAAGGWYPQDDVPRATQLTDSLLATAEQNIGLDWKEREPLRARLKVAFKRALVQLGFDARNADEAAGRLVGWLQSAGPNSDDRSETLTGTTGAAA